jgi:murein DD-endopeptidase MepM/ murein hydrolase activator NlpD
VRAARGGKVIFAGWKGNDGGYQVWLTNGPTLGSGYYHLSRILVGFGQSISVGQIIGRVGMTGHATGCHLHFEVWRPRPWAGVRVNPLALLP